MYTIYIRLHLEHYADSSVVRGVIFCPRITWRSCLSSAVWFGTMKILVLSKLAERAFQDHCLLLNWFEDAPDWSVGNVRSGAALWTDQVSFLVFVVFIWWSEVPWFCSCVPLSFVLPLGSLPSRVTSDGWTVSQPIAWGISSTLSVSPMPNSNANQARWSPHSDMWLYYISFQFSNLTYKFQNTCPIKKTIFPIT